MLLPAIAQFIKTFHGKGALFILDINVGNIPDDTTGQSKTTPRSGHMPNLFNTNNTAVHKMTTEEA